MTGRRLAVLLAQVCPVPGDPRANVAALERTLAEHPDAELAVFPEMFLPGYTLAGLADLATPLDGPVLARVRAAARRHRTAVVVGLAEPVAGGAAAGGATAGGATAGGATVDPAVTGPAVTNTVAGIDADGRLAGRYRKVHLFAGERRAFARGDRYEVLTLAGLRVGLLNCYDVEFPEPARALAVAGIDLLVTVAANMHPYALEHDLFVRARAVENRVTHVYVNRVGQESGLTFLGSSLVIDPAGATVAALPEDRAAVCVVDVPVGGTPRPDYLAERAAGLAVHVNPPAPLDAPLEPQEGPR